MAARRSSIFMASPLCLRQIAFSSVYAQGAWCVQSMKKHASARCVPFLSSVFIRSRRRLQRAPEHGLQRLIVRPADASEPVEAVRIARDVVHAPVARQRRLKAHVAQDGVRQVAVLAVGIGKRVRRAAGVLGELILQALQVRAQQLRIGRVRLTRFCMQPCRSDV